MTCSAGPCVKPADMLRDLAVAFNASAVTVTAANTAAAATASPPDSTDDELIQQTHAGAQLAAKTADVADAGKPPGSAHREAVAFANAAPEVSVQPNNQAVKTAASVLKACAIVAEGVGREAASSDGVIPMGDADGGSAEAGVVSGRQDVMNGADLRSASRTGSAMGQSAVMSAAPVLVVTGWAARVSDPVEMVMGPTKSGEDMTASVVVESGIKLAHQGASIAAATEVAQQGLSSAAVTQLAQQGLHNSAATELTQQGLGIAAWCKALRTKKPGAILKSTVANTQVAGSNPTQISAESAHATIVQAAAVAQPADLGACPADIINVGSRPEQDTLNVRCKPWLTSASSSSSAAAAAAAQGGFGSVQGRQSVSAAASAAQGMQYQQSGVRSSISSGHEDVMAVGGHTKSSQAGVVTDGCAAVALPASQVDTVPGGSGRSLLAEHAEVPRLLRSGIMSQSLRIYVLPLLLWYLANAKIAVAYAACLMIKEKRSYWVNKVHCEMS